MGKRKTHGGDGTQVGKRQKTNHVHEAPTSEDVYNARQLRQLLTFEQDMRQARHGLQSFKNLLDGILSGSKEDSSDKLQIVTQFLTSTKPREVEDEVPIYLPDLMETWGMAARVNNENVMSASAVVLALLLRVISNNDGLTSHGLGIGRTLLQKKQLELIAKNITAEKGKDFIISPTLRLLREALCLDSGTLAAPIFRARASTLKALARNIGLRFLGEGIEDPTRPSVRTNAIRFLLGCMKFLHVEAKRDLLSQKDIVAALMRNIRDDPPALIYEILETMRSSVVLDKKLPKDVKIRLLNAHSLSRIASLYGYTHGHDNAGKEDDSSSAPPSVDETAHKFLLAACTDASGGLVRSQHGFYPEGLDPDAVPLASDGLQIASQGIDSVPWMSKFDDEVPVRNSLLAEFIQSLRPWSNTKQSELLVAIFKSAPELVAHYFIHKRAFSFDPKLSATWIGYAALLYNVVELPIPPFFGHQKGYARIPPPINIVLGNTIPGPLSLKAMSRCLSSKSNLVSFYAVRIIVLVLQRLSTILGLYAEASVESGPLWREAARRLVDEVQQRIPDVKDIIGFYRGLGDDDLLQREATSRLILLYYETIPQLALRAKFDVSPILSASILKVEKLSERNEEAVLALMELEHLCSIAKYSPGMRWFTRVSSSNLSPFTILLKLYVERTTDLSEARLKDVLHFVADENQLVESTPQLPGLQPLIAALKSVGNFDASVWAFLDNCFERCARSPIKYLEMVEEQLEEADIDSSAGAISCPLMVTIGEQIPFLVASAPDKKTLKSLVEILSEFLGHSLSAGVSEAFLGSTKNLFAAGLGDSKLVKKLSISERSSTETNEDIPKSQKAQKGKIHGLPTEKNASKLNPQDLEEMLSVPIPAVKDNALLRWSTKTPEELVEEGHAASVIWLLASEHPSIRKEALVTLVKMAVKIKESPYEENEQVWLLLMELAESAREPANIGAVPHILLAFAARALDVLKNPLHPLYEKTNLFLTSGPVWALDRIPLLYSIVQEGPAEDSAFYTEVSWLLGFLLDSLRSPDDIALFHKRKVFERVFALASNPYMGNNLRTQILRLVYRASSIPGGSDTLITRFGVVSWLKTQKAATNEAAEAQLYQAVIARLWETCDQKRIEAWSNGGIRNIAKEV